MLNMAVQIFIFVALAAISNAAVIPGSPVLAAVQSPAQYKFGYAVNDPITGDNKHQEETRIGDAVRGSYSLVEPDGTRRIVDYFDDGVSGFHAVVRKEPLVASHVAPAVVASPAVRVVAPQVQLAAPTALRSWSGLYSPYHAAYSNPWYSSYVNPYFF
ncbi:hypothetical protein WA026_002472 [Henosepilachna vigintioctopunctata]|uniref:Uncharacterized protein n=1 Tax=Henosepilachna vigintioctopunctata TaxID=420089 RepID=A0AAW1U0H5_9CUCU